MPSMSVNGIPVMQARIARPRVGNWTAELAADADLASQLPPGTPATVHFGSVDYVGTSIRSDAYAQNVTLRVQGGAGGLGKDCAPQFYSQVPASKPLQDALASVGESLSGTSDPQALGKALAFWTTIKQPVSHALTSLAQAAGADVVWRVLPDGSVFFGADGFADSVLTDFELVDFMPLEGLQVISSEDPIVNPGESFSGRNVSVVEHLLSAGKTRTRVWFE